MDKIQRNKSFLKWAGGKTHILDTLLPLLPTGEGYRLVEPFAGSAVVALNAGMPARICDTNEDLIEVFKWLKRPGHNSFIDECRVLFAPRNNTAKRYYKLRKEFNEDAEGARKAALFVYLNRHCFNGICRYNLAGGFNVPFGRYGKDGAGPGFPEKEMQLFHKLATRPTKQLTFFAQDFSATFQQSLDKPQDVFYCDPPFVPLSKTADFVAYTADGFGMEKHVQLAQCAIEAQRRGNYVFISNHDTSFTRGLYSSHAQIIPLESRRSINCHVTKRGPAKEILAVFRPRRSK